MSTAIPLWLGSIALLAVPTPPGGRANAVDRDRATSRRLRKEKGSSSQSRWAGRGDLFGGGVAALARARGDFGGAGLSADQSPWLEGEFAAHSMRAGLATSAARAGKTEASIMLHGRWRSVVVARRFIRARQRWDDNAAAGLL